MGLINYWQKKEKEIMMIIELIAKDQMMLAMRQIKLI